VTTIYARSSKNVLDRALVADDERADCSGLARKLLGTFLWTTVRSPARDRRGGEGGAALAVARVAARGAGRDGRERRGVGETGCERRTRT